MKTKTKTRVSTRTAVTVVAVALLGLGLVAYGYGFGFGIKLTPSKSNTSLPGLGGLVQERPSIGDSRVSLPAPPADITTTPKNRPIVTALSTDSPTLKGIITDFPLYKWKIDPLKDQNTYGKISFKQFVFQISISNGMQLSDFDIKILDGGKLLNAGSHTSIAVPIDDASITMYVNKNQSSLISYYKPKNYLLFVSFPYEFVLRPLGTTLVLQANVNSLYGTGQKQVTARLLGPSGTVQEWSKDHAGYLAYNRAVQTPNGVEVPASKDIYHTIRLEPPVDSNTNDLAPTYLHISPTIWSDNHSTTHDTRVGVQSGSKDWFQLTGDYKTETHL